MQTTLRNFIIIAIGSILLTACSNYERVLKSNDVNYKLTKANQYYEQKRYQQANAVYESLLLVMKNTKNYEPLYYRYAYSYYHLDDFLSASYHFKNFVDFFPNSKDAEECEYMHAYCLFKESPKPSLDQNYTRKALGAMQTYINAYPNSKRIKEANQIVQESHAKLQKKAADAAKLYYNIGQYKAASVAYRYVLTEYPESSRADEYKYMIMKSWYEYAKQSIRSKQEERYANVLSSYKELQQEFPNSKYLSDAKKYFSLADDNIKKLRNEQ
ncbi:MAG: outer membrane protein assembly factor BamD [Chitinophagales bacterium]|nr:outer membrane protein assembly factor BamD [Chitinophagaceae bacterium]MCB9063723.1 outer membrane protein assembly factor BamD [Chitinophagales bacterium]